MIKAAEDLLIPTEQMLVEGQLDQRGRLFQHQEAMTLFHLCSFCHMVDRSVSSADLLLCLQETVSSVFLVMEVSRFRADPLLTCYSPVSNALSLLLINNVMRKVHSRPSTS